LRKLDASCFELLLPASVSQRELNSMREAEAGSGELEKLA
jgi:hypothetical protein